MDPRGKEASFPRTSPVKCCDCGCICSLKTSSFEPSWLRSVKRKYDEYEEGNRSQMRGLGPGQVARVGIEYECDALRDMVNKKQLIIDQMSADLDEERNASSTAANEAMSMILRLQREKAEIQMEARQFKRFAEEKMSHDAEEITAYEELLYKRDQTIQSLTCEVQAYKHRMMSFGASESEAEGLDGAFTRNQSFSDLDIPVESPPCAYPPLKCNLNDAQPSEYYEDVVDIEKHPFDDTPCDQYHLQKLEYRIDQLERSPRCYPLDGDVSGSKNILDKVIVGPSPRKARDQRKFSTVSSNSSFGHGPEIGNANFKKLDCVSEELKKSDDASDLGDGVIDRVYTIDSIHHRTPRKSTMDHKVAPGICEDYVSSPRGSLHRADLGDMDVKKLYLRLQALEADRESLRQTIVSMQTDKAQLVLLREIAQHLCKDMSTERRIQPVKKPSFIWAFSLLAAFKWVMSLIFWRTKARRTKYTFGLSPNNAGLLCLLDKGPPSKRWRCITSAKVSSFSV